MSGAGAPATPGPGPAPVTTVRLIVRYAKRGRMRFASHRDIARAVERGVRRAGLPIAYSAGFTPHPKISYAGAAPTGTASEAEYLEISLTEARAASDVRDRLDAALPDGIDVIDVIEGQALAGLRLEASQWEVVLPGVQPAAAALAAGEFLARGSLEVDRLTAKGSRRVDARAAVITIETDRSAGSPAPGNAVLRMVVRHVMPAVRPDDILAALRQVADLAPSSPALVTRLAQGPLPAGAASVTAAADGHAPGGQEHPSGTAPPSGRGGTPEHMTETTRLGAEPALVAGAFPAGACDEFPRGAGDPRRSAAPGNLTGEYPHARDRAERCRAQ
ncbi:MAG TPA: TIGR03936 family radical SAM-associated protein [Streptosporangiaceae bacterium]